MSTVGRAAFQLVSPADAWLADRLSANDGDELANASELGPLGPEALSGVRALTA